MHPTELAERLGLSPDTLDRVCAKLQITGPAGANGAFSAEQVRQISEFVEARQRARDQRAAQGEAPPSRELGERSFGEQKSSRTPNRTRPIGDAFAEPGPAGRTTSPTR